jgi:F420-dependent oxidoreductase-like protein
MKLGLHAGYWGLGVSGQDQLQMAKTAEELGYESVWAAEAYGSDTATVLAWLASNTERIKIGSGIFQIPARTPTMTAMTAATLDNISNGRMLLGIGVSGPQVSEGWHGVPFKKPLKRTREYVEILRKALGRERVTYEGEFYTLPLPGGPGKPLKLIIEPVQEHMPIYIAAIGPKNTALTAEIADGWLPTIFSPEHIDTFKPSLEEGAARAGKDLKNFDIAPMVSAAIDDDRDRARDLMRPFLALYIGGMGSRDKNFYTQLVTRYGWGDDAKKIQDLYLDKKHEQAMAAIPAELIDSVALCGPKDVVKDRLEAYRAAGVGTLMVSPVAESVEERLRMMRELAEVAGTA